MVHSKDVTTWARPGMPRRKVVQSKTPTEDSWVGIRKKGGMELGHSLIVRPFLHLPSFLFSGSSELGRQSVWQLDMRLREESSGV